MPRLAGTTALLWLALGIGSVRAADPPPDFARDVQPLLKARCVRCHGPAERKAKLNVATPRGLARGGENGAAVVPGKLDESLAWERVEADEMPPKEPLSADEKATLRRWIEAGAPGLPREASAGPEEADHWAFAPLRRPTPPRPRDASRARNAIDLFVLARLESENLTLSAESDGPALVRRLAIDLTGLPPSPEETADDPPRVVDRLLASPAYGERWGKYWLDAAGYADSNGYFNADSDRPLAWKYRDWVVRAVNRDLPFEAFVVEQLAGDELAGYKPGAEVTPELIDHLVATHFLRNGQDGTGESDGNPDEVRADRYSALEGAVQVIGSSLLGLTTQCARCHDHKFEPITQRDYYAIQAVLRPAFPADDGTKWKKPNDRVVTAALAHEQDRWEAANLRIDVQVAARKAEFLEWSARIDASERKARAKEIDAKKKKLDEAVKKLEAGRVPNPGRIAWVTDYATDLATVHILKRGDYGAAGAAVEPSGPSALSDADNPFELKPPDEKAPTTGRRLAFARWLTRPGSRPAALLARVTANRAWQYHFGVGLVATSENFGYSGAAPSHPELLDYLASALVDSGWSLKALHRLIVDSATYRQATQPTSESSERAFRVDPDARLLSRFPLRRLDAEALRDAMLAVSGELDKTVGGPFVPSRRTEDGEVVIDDKAAGAHRRSLYLQSRRTQTVSLLEVFDAPSIVTVCPRRPSATIPLQSLSLLNSPFAAARAKAMAERLAREAGDDVDARLGRAFRLAAARPPEPDELAAARDFLAAQPARYPELSPPEAERRAWVDFCQMLLASNAFLYVE